MKFDSLLFDYDDAGRPEILEAVNAAMKRYLNGDECTGLQVAPRVGKQSISVLTSNEARAQGAPFVHNVVPWANLNNQIVDAKKNKRTFDFYKARGTIEPFRADIVESVPHHKYYCNYKHRPTLLTSTVQLLYANIGVITEAVRYAIGQTGKRPIFIIDEAQLMGLGLPWYEMIKKLIDAGAYIISMTGTEKRIDKKPIIGFQLLEVEGSEEVEACSQLKGIATDGDGNKIATVALGTRRSAEFEVVPVGSVPVPISTAFDRGWCAPMDVKMFDFEIMNTDDGSKFLISEASLEKSRPNLVDWLQSDECVRVAVKNVLDDLVRRRVDLGLKDAKAMFVTLSDIGPAKNKKGKMSDEGANYHARKIRKEFLTQLSLLPSHIRKQMGRVNAEICTSMLASGEPDNAAVEKLKRFALIEMDNDGNEPIDVLFVKNMGVVGLDVPQLKTMVNLCNNSADAPTTLQANLRIATNWEESNAPALLILPAHYHGKQFRDMCGKWSNKIRVSNFEEEAEDSIIIKEKEKEIFEVIDGTGKIHSYSDHNGQTIEDDMEAVLLAVRHKYKAANQLSYYQLIETIKQGAFPLADEDMLSALATETEMVALSGVQVIDVSEQREAITKENNESFGKKAKRLASKLVNYNEQPDRWKSINQRLVAKAKSKCGIDTYKTMQDIVDPEVLSELMDHLDNAFIDIKREFDYERGLCNYRNEYAGVML
jgi:hypothetical protein